MLRLSRAQLREVDRVSIEEYGLPGIVLMENAARSVADAIETRYADRTERPRQGIVVSGGGNNGGDGYAIARLLHNFGWQMTIVALIPTTNLHGDAAIMAGVAGAMGIPIRNDLVPLSDARFVVDAITGTGLSRPLDGKLAEAVELINAAGRPVISVDVPSGLDCDSGEPLGDACVRAQVTVTFVAAKLGFANPRSEEFTGEVIVGDIGCPIDVINRVARD